MSKIVLYETTPPVTPSTGTIAIYAKPDGYVYAKNDSGVEVLLSNSDSALLDHISADDPHPQYLKETTSRKIEYVTIDITQLINKKIILDKTPINPQFVQVDIKEGGGALFYGVDFIIVGNELRWETYEYEFIVDVDDKLRIIYDHN